MDLSRYVVLDCTSGTFFNAAHAVLIELDDLPEGLEESMLDEGSDTDRCELADIYGIDLEAWSPPDSKESRALDAVASLLDNEQWSSDHIEAVADMVRDTGRAIGDDFHADAPSESSPL
jgi:hypothetical protein